MVVPAPLLSLYQQYKQDTNYVAAWLATTAKSCGYPSDLLSEIQAKTEASEAPESSKPAKNKAKGGKGKKKKQTDQAPKKYTVAVKEFIPLAQYISTAKHKSSNVPDILVSALNRVIDLRTRFSAKLTQDGAKPATASDLKHGYFLGILIQVRDVLRPRMTAAGARASRDGFDSSTNRFAGLSIFEPTKAFMDAPDVKLPSRKDKVLYEAELGASLEDAIFFFQMLWRDLWDLRMRVRVSWRRHMQGHDMAAAAVAANVALDLARHVINDYSSAFENFEGGIYGAMKEHAVLMHYRVKANPADMNFGLLRPGQAEEDIDDDQIMYGAGLWSFVNAYNMLADTLPSLATTGTPFSFLPKNPTHEAGMENFEYAEMLAVVKTIFEDLMVIIESIPNWPIEDTLLRGLREALETREVPFHLVFATATMTDMHAFFSQGVHLTVDTHIIDKFLETVGAIQGMFGDYFTSLKEAGSLEVMEPYDEPVRKADKELTWLMDEDPVLQAKLNKLPKSAREQAKTELEKHRHFKYNAMMCGLALYRYRMVLYRSGIALVNASRSLISGMHLWNAIIIEKLQVPGPWADSKVMSVRLEDQFEELFLNGTPHESNPGYVKNISLLLGFSVFNFTDRSKAMGKRARLLDGTKGMISERVPMHMAFYDRYVTYDGKTGSENWTFEDVTALVERVKGPTFKAKYPADLIKELSALLEDELMVANLPFLVFHAESFRILKFVRDKCEPMLVPIVGPPDKSMKAAINIPLVTVWILQAMAADDAGANVLRAARDVIIKKLVNDQARAGRAYKRYQELGYMRPPKEDGEDEEAKEQKVIPVRPGRTAEYMRKANQPVNLGRVHESFGMPLDISRLPTGAYIETSNMSADEISRMRRTTEVKTINLSDDDEPMEITHTTLSFR